jgi:DNA (cytosine-5)-methyltransferase 1
MVETQPNPKVRSQKIEVVGLIDGKDNQGYRVASTHGKGFTLCANSGGPGAKTGLYLVSGMPRRLTARECARMQGFPESFKPHARPSVAKRQFGNSVAVPVVAAIAKQVSQAIR